MSTNGTHFIRRNARRIATALLALPVASVMAALTPIPGSASTYFADDFETGTLSAWSMVTSASGGSAIVQNSTVNSGNYAAQFTSTSTSGSVAYARKSFSSAVADTTASADFLVSAEGPSNSNVPLFRLLDANSNRVVSIYRQNVSNDQLWLKLGSSYFSTTGTLPLNTWRHLDLHVIVSGSSSLVEARLNGSIIYSSNSAPLGTVGIQTTQIGNDSPGQAGTAVVDNVNIAIGSSSTSTTTSDTTTSTSSTTSSTTTSSTTTTIAPGTAATIVGAGDIAACNNPGDEATANLVKNIPGTVVDLGDNVYPNGTYSEFTDCYGPSWGQFKWRTRPATGNHEYVTSGASGYFSYFGSSAGDKAKGYYSYNIDAWHIVVLNSNCSQIGGCYAGSTQEKWLRADLASSSSACTLAYWHHPLFSSGSEGSTSSVKPLWDALYYYGAEVVLNGHDHDYERFAPQTSSGVANSTFGIREFIVGTGGYSHFTLKTRIANSEVSNDRTFGVIKLNLYSNSYDWKFLPVAGSTFTDSGSGTCHGRP